MVQVEHRDLPDIPKLVRPNVIGVAEGPAKVVPILGALHGGLLNTLVTDVRTAEAILDAAGEGGA